MRKHIWTAAVLLALLAGICTINAFATEVVASGECGDNLTWTLDDAGILTISGTGEMGDSAPWLNNSDSITSVVIESGVTTIGAYAFVNCNSLTEVTIPDSVTSISDGAFEACGGLTEVTIPDSVTSIGDFAFEACGGLTEVTIGNSVTSIGYSAFSNCGSLTKVTIGNSVTSIGDLAFSNCGLTTITIPDSVTSIGYSAFYNCGSLTKVTIPDSVTSISDSAFEKCGSLTTIMIPDSVTSIGTSAFFNCGLTTITIPDSVTSIGDHAFYECGSLTEVTIGNSVISIAYSAFYNCGSLTEVTIGNSVTSIGRFAFYNCGSLTDVYYGGASEQWAKISIDDGNDALTNATLHMIIASGTCGDNLTWTLDDAGILTISGTGEMEDSAPWLDNSNSITSVVIESGVTTIGEWVFYSCYSLTSITIPDSVTTIGEGAFSYCSSLTSVTIPDSVTTISNSAFSDCYSLTEIMVDANNKNYSAVNGILFNKAQTTLICYPAGKEETVYTIPDSVTTIGERAFSDCDSLTSVTIPDSVTTIGEGAFAYCGSLTSVTIPDSVTTIGEGAFYNCGSLTDVYYGGASEQWAKISIGDYNDALTNAILHFGRILAGWFVDETFETASTGDDDKNYAKCVDPAILTVKWQILKGASASSESTNLRLITSVDSLNYENVGFVVKIGDGDETEHTSTKVYAKISGLKDGTETDFYPTVFSEDSQWFMSYRYDNIPRADFDTSITVTPFWTTLDGTKVTGETRTFKISDASGFTN